MSLASARAHSAITTQTQLATAMRSLPRTTEDSAYSAPDTVAAAGLQNAPPAWFGTPVIAAFRPAPHRVAPPPIEKDDLPAQIATLGTYRKHIQQVSDPLAWAGAFARAAVEALLGIRNTNQLSRWMTVPLFSALERRVRLNAALRPDVKHCAARVLGMHLQSPVADVYEANASVLAAGRTYCVAIAFRRYHHKLQVTALEIG